MDCIFCKIASKEIPSKIVYEDDKVLAFMDINPTCDGHTLIIPKEHFETVFDIPKELLEYMYKIANKLLPIIMKSVNEDGASLAFNFGSRQVIKHAHLHILPNPNKKSSKSVDEVYKLIMENINGEA